MSPSRRASKAVKATVLRMRSRPAFAESDAVSKEMFLPSAAA
jgi:hypothetical protein